MEISLIIPCLNEARTISQVINDCIKYYGADSQIIIVDNGSTDGSQNIIQTLAQSNSNLLYLECGNKGKSNAIKFALIRVKYNDVVLQDGDNEYSIQDTAQIALMHLSGAYDMSIGVRTNKMLLRSTLANYLVRTVILLKFGKTLPDVLTGSRVVKLDLLKRCNSKQFGLETELTKIAIRDKLKIQTAECKYQPRTKGKKIKAKHLSEILWCALS